MGKTGRREDVKPPSIGAEAAAVERFEQGLELLHRKQWEEAARAFSQVTEGTPGSSIAERARVYREVCRQKLSNEPVAEGDPYLTAVVAKNQGDLEAAMESCNRGGLKGKDARFTYLAAAIEGLRGNQDEAAKLLVKAIETRPRQSGPRVLGPRLRRRAQESRSSSPLRASSANGFYHSLR